MRFDGETSYATCNVRWDAEQEVKVCDGRINRGQTHGIASPLLVLL
jgi:hypothetical protein